MSEEYLAHYGVLGMKWGIRRYQPYGQGYSGSTGRFVPTGNAKKDAKALKKHIQATRKAYGDKNHHELGENVARVAKEQQKAEKSSAKLADLNKRYKDVSEKAKDASLDYVILYDELSQIEPSNTKAYRSKAAAVENAENKANNLDEKAYALGEEIYQEKRKIGKQFSEDYRNAAAKDLGFADVEEGKRLLDKYDLMSRAVNGSMLPIEPSDVRQVRR